MKAANHPENIPQYQVLTEKYKRKKVNRKKSQENGSVKMLLYQRTHPVSKTRYVHANESDSEMNSISEGYSGEPNLGQNEYAVEKDGEEVRRRRSRGQLQLRLKKVKKYETNITIDKCSESSISGKEIHTKYCSSKTFREDKCHYLERFSKRDKRDLVCVYDLDNNDDRFEKYNQKIVLVKKDNTAAGEAVFERLARSSLRLKKMNRRKADNDNNVGRGYLLDKNSCRYKEKTSEVESYRYGKEADGDNGSGQIESMWSKDEEYQSMSSNESESNFKVEEIQDLCIRFRRVGYRHSRTAIQKSQYHQSKVCLKEIDEHKANIYTDVESSSVKKHSEDIGMFHCVFCIKSFPSGEALDDHYMTHFTTVHGLNSFLKNQHLKRDSELKRTSSSLTKYSKHYDSRVKKEVAVDIDVDEGVDCTSPGTNSCEIIELQETELQLPEHMTESQHTSDNEEVPKTEEIEQKEVSDTSSELKLRIPNPEGSHCLAGSIKDDRFLISSGSESLYCTHNLELAKSCINRVVKVALSPLKVENNKFIKNSDLSGDLMKEPVQSSLKCVWSLKDRSKSEDSVNHTKNEKVQKQSKGSLKLTLSKCLLSSKEVADKSTKKVRKRKNKLNCNSNNLSGQKQENQCIFDVAERKTHDKRKASVPTFEILNKKLCDVNLNPLSDAQDIKSLKPAESFDHGSEGSDAILNLKLHGEIESEKQNIDAEIGSLTSEMKQEESYIVLNNNDDINCQEETEIDSKLCNSDLKPRKEETKKENFGGTSKLKKNKCCRRYRKTKSLTRMKNRQTSLEFGSNIDENKYIDKKENSKRKIFHQSGSHINRIIVSERSVDTDLKQLNDHTATGNDFHLQNKTWDVLNADTENGSRELNKNDFVHRIPKNRDDKRFFDSCCEDMLFEFASDLDIEFQLNSPHKSVRKFDENAMFENLENLNCKEILCSGNSTASESVCTEFIGDNAQEQLDFRELENGPFSQFNVNDRDSLKKKSCSQKGNTFRSSVSLPQVSLDAISACMAITGLQPQENKEENEKSISNLNDEIGDHVDLNSSQDILSKRFSEKSYFRAAEDYEKDTPSLCDGEKDGKVQSRMRTGSHEMTYVYGEPKDMPKVLETKGHGNQTTHSSNRELGETCFGYNQTVLVVGMDSCLDEMPSVQCTEETKVDDEVCYKKGESLRQPEIHTESEKEDLDTQFSLPALSCEDVSVVLENNSRSQEKNFNSMNEGWSEKLEDDSLKKIENVQAEIDIQNVGRSNRHDIQNNKEINRYSTQNCEEINKQDKHSREETNRHEKLNKNEINCHNKQNIEEFNRHDKQDCKETNRHDKQNTEEFIRHYKQNNELIKSQMKQSHTNELSGVLVEMGKLNSSSKLKKRKHNSHIESQEQTKFEKREDVNNNLVDVIDVTNTEEKRKDLQESDETQSLLNRNDDVKPDAIMQWSRMKTDKVEKEKCSPINRFYRCEICKNLYRAVSTLHLDNDDNYKKGGEIVTEMRQSILCDKHSANAKPNIRDDSSEEKVKGSPEQVGEQLSLKLVLQKVKNSVVGVDSNKHKMTISLEQPLWKVIDSQTNETMTKDFFEHPTEDVSINEDTFKSNNLGAGENHEEQISENLDIENSTCKINESCSVGKIKENYSEAVKIRREMEIENLTDSLRDMNAENSDREKTSQHVDLCIKYAKPESLVGTRNSLKKVNVKMGHSAEKIDCSEELNEFEKALLKGNIEKKKDKVKKKKKQKNVIKTESRQDSGEKVYTEDNKTLLYNRRNNNLFFNSESLQHFQKSKMAQMIYSKHKKENSKLKSHDGLPDFSETKVNLDCLPPLSVSSTHLGHLSPTISEKDSGTCCKISEDKASSGFDEVTKPITGGMKDVSVVSCISNISSASNVVTAKTQSTVLNDSSDCSKVEGNFHSCLQEDANERKLKGVNGNETLWTDIIDSVGLKTKVEKDYDRKNFKRLKKELESIGILKDENTMEKVGSNSDVAFSSPWNSQVTDNFINNLQPVLPSFSQTFSKKKLWPSEKNQLFSNTTFFSKMSESKSDEVSKSFSSFNDEKLTEVDLNENKLNEIGKSPEIQVLTVSDKNVEQNELDAGKPAGSYMSYSEVLLSNSVQLSPPAVRVKSGLSHVKLNRTTMNFSSTPAVKRPYTSVSAAPCFELNISQICSSSPIQDERGDLWSPRRRQIEQFEVNGFQSEGNVSQRNENILQGSPLSSMLILSADCSKIDMTDLSGPSVYHDVESSLNENMKYKSSFHDEASLTQNFQSKTIKEGSVINQDQTQGVESNNKPASVKECQSNERYDKRLEERRNESSDEGVSRPVNETLLDYEEDYSSGSLCSGNTLTEVSSNEVLDHSEELSCIQKQKGRQNINNKCEFDSLRFPPTFSREKDVNGESDNRLIEKQTDSEQDSRITISTRSVEDESAEIEVDTECEEDNTITCTITEAVGSDEERFEVEREADGDEELMDDVLDIYASDEEASFLLDSPSLDIPIINQCEVDADKKVDMTCEVEDMEVESEFDAENTSEKANFTVVDQQVPLQQNVLQPQQNVPQPPHYIPVYRPLRSNPIKGRWMPKGWCYRYFSGNTCNPQCVFRHDNPTEDDLRRCITEITEKCKRGELDSAMNMLVSQQYFMENLREDDLECLYGYSVNNLKMEYCHTLLQIMSSRDLIKQGHIDYIILLWKQLGSSKDIEILKDVFFMAKQKTIYPQQMAAVTLVEAFSTFGDMYILWDLITYCTQNGNLVISQQYINNAVTIVTYCQEISLLSEVVGWLEQARSEQLYHINSEVLQRLKKTLQEMNLVRLESSVEQCLLRKKQMSTGAGLPSLSEFSGHQLSHTAGYSMNDCDPSTLKQMVTKPSSAWASSRVFTQFNPDAANMRLYNGPNRTSFTVSGLSQPNTDLVTHFDLDSEKQIEHHHLPQSREYNSSLVLNRGLEQQKAVKDNTSLQNLANMFIHYTQMGPPPQVVFKQVLLAITRDDNSIAKSFEEFILHIKQKGHPSGHLQYAKRRNNFVQASHTLLSVACSVLHGETLPGFSKVAMTLIMPFNTFLFELDESNLFYYLLELMRNPGLRLDRTSLSDVSSELFCFCHHRGLQDTKDVLLLILDTEFLSLSWLVGQRWNTCLEVIAADLLLSNGMPERTAQILIGISSKQRLEAEMKTRFLSFLQPVTQQLCTQGKLTLAYQIFCLAFRWKHRGLQRIASDLIQACLQGGVLDIPTQIYELYLAEDKQFDILEEVKRSMLIALFDTKREYSINLYQDIIQNTSTCLYLQQSFKKPRCIWLLPFHTNSEIKLIIEQYLQDLYVMFCDQVGKSAPLIEQDLSLDVAVDTLVVIQPNQFKIPCFGQGKATVSSVKQLLLKEFGIESTITCIGIVKLSVQQASLQSYMKELDQKDGKLGLDFG